MDDPITLALRVGAGLTGLSGGFVAIVFAYGLLLNTVRDRCWRTGLLAAAALFSAWAMFTLFGIALTGIN